MRLRSLDVLRGVTMAGMVVVNNPGDWATVYAPLLHAEWHGWTPTDLIFPAFLFIAGAALVQGAPDRQRPWAIVRRGAVLVGLGLFLSGFPFFNPARWRIPGVLQRIGLCTTISALLWRALAVPGQPLQTARRLALVAAVCLLGHWALLALVAPRGGLAGDLSAAGNLGAWLDRAVFGTHLWKTTWDPEGLLGSLPAVGTTLIGAVAGLWIARARPHSAALPLAGAGLTAVVVGLTWHAVLPINKSLWSSSYALFSGGVALLALALVHQPLDDGRSSPWLDRLSEPFVALGRNALLLFVLSGVVGRVLNLLTIAHADGTTETWQRAIYVTVFAPLAAPKLASLLYAVTALGGLYALLAWLHRRRWYWSV